MRNPRRIDEYENCSLPHIWGLFTEDLFSWGFHIDINIYRWEKIDINTWICKTGDFQILRGRVGHENTQKIRISIGSSPYKDFQLSNMDCQTWH